MHQQSICFFLKSMNNDFLYTLISDSYQAAGISMILIKETLFLGHPLLQKGVQSGSPIILYLYLCKGRQLVTMTLNLNNKEWGH